MTSSSVVESSSGPVVEEIEEIELEDGSIQRTIKRKQLITTTISKKMVDKQEEQFQIEHNGHGDVVYLNGTDPRQKSVARQQNPPSSLGVASIANGSAGTDLSDCDAVAVVNGLNDVDLNSPISPTMSSPGDEIDGNEVVSFEHGAPEKLMVQGRAAARSRVVEEVATTEGPVSEEVEEITQPDGSILRRVKTSKQTTTTSSRKTMAAKKAQTCMTAVHADGSESTVFTDFGDQETFMDPLIEVVDTMGSDDDEDKSGTGLVPLTGPPSQRGAVRDDKGNSVRLFQTEGGVTMGGFSGVGKLAGAVVSPAGDTVTEEIINPDGTKTLITRKIKDKGTAMKGQAVLHKTGGTGKGQGDGSAAQSRQTAPKEIEGEPGCTESQSINEGCSQGPLIEEVDDDVDVAESPANGPVIEEVDSD